MTPRTLFLCLTIVAAFRVPLFAAPPASEDLAVPPTTAALAKALGIDPARDRARFMPELVRLVYARPDVKSAASLRANGVGRVAASASGLSPDASLEVPVPLGADVWTRTILRRSVPRDRLVEAIVDDRQAALLCYALAALDDETLVFLAGRSDILRALYERAPGAFAAFGASLRILDGHVVPPGGAAAAPLWESVLHEPADRPERFLRALLEDNDGRFGYLYRIVGTLDPPHARFALGLWIEDGERRASRFALLAAVCLHQYSEWRAPEMPFSKPLNDLGIALMRVRVDASGAPAEPRSLAFWNGTFETALSGENGSIDAAWLAEVTSPGGMFGRADRLDQFAFGQRAFARVGEREWQDTWQTIRAFPRQRMLMLTLERVGVRSPAVYLYASRRARAITETDPNRAFWNLAQLQGSLALVTRMVLNGTLSTASAEKLVMSLFGVATSDGGRYGGGIAQWIDRVLLPALPLADTVEETVLTAVAGITDPTKAPRIVWEGQKYRIDFAAAEKRRIQAVREKQGASSLDTGVELARLAAAWRSEARTGEELRRDVARLRTVEASFKPESGKRPQFLVPGVEYPKSVRELISRITEDLARAAATGDGKRAARLAAPLAEVSDFVLTEALLSVVYAMDLGDPDGAALLASNVALRHDFGLGVDDSDVRARTAWAVPRQDFLPGIPWHVTGALVGLDVALAPLTLRRINVDAAGDVPRVPSNERDAFAVGVSLMNVRSLTDADRDRIVEAIERGAARVARLAVGEEPVDHIASEILLDGWRERELRWWLRVDGSRVPPLFSLAELMILGGGAAGADVDAWATQAIYAFGCICTRFDPPSEWQLLDGRPQVALMSSIVPDLNFRVAAVLKDLALPASLARVVLNAAAQDFIDHAAPTGPHDWRGMAIAAQAVTRQRIEDYVAAAAAIDGPLIPDEPGTPPR